MTYKRQSVSLSPHAAAHIDQRSTGSGSGADRCRKQVEMPVNLQFQITY